MEHGNIHVPRVEDALRPDRSALLVVDFQRDISPPSYVDALARTRRLISAARQYEVRIIYVQNVVLPSNLSNSPAETARRRKLGLSEETTLEGTRGQEFVDEVSPLAGDIVVRKHRLNSFRGTGLDVLLRSQGLETVICTGAATHGCVMATAFAAQGLDYYVAIAEDCVATWDSGLHEAALTVLSNVVHYVISCDEIIDHWARSADTVKAPAESVSP